MTPIKANTFLAYLQGEADAFRSILQLTEHKAQELLDSDKELDAARSRLAAHLMQTHSKPVNGADALLIALERAEMKLQAIAQTVQSVTPTLEL